MITDEFGVQYSDDGKTLLKIPVDLAGEYIIPDGIEVMEAHAFEWRRGHKPRLTSLTICKSMRVIKFNHGLTCLESLVVDVENPVFDSRENCNCIIESSTDTIMYSGKNSFIPNGVKVVGPWAFFPPVSTSVKKIFIPASVTKIERCAFQNIEAEEIVVAKENQHFDSRENCNAIIRTETNTLIKGCGKTTIPYGVETIGYMAFEIETYIDDLLLPESIVAIADFAFYGTEIGNLKVPKSVRKIGLNAFGYSGIKHLCVDESNPVFDSRGDCGCIIDSEENRLVATGQNFEIPSSVRVLGHFSIYSNIDFAIRIPEGVEVIEDAALQLGSRKMAIIFPNSVQYIGKQSWFMDRIERLYVPKGQKERFASMVGMKGIRSKIHELKD